MRIEGQFVGRSGLSPPLLCASAQGHIPWRIGLLMRLGRACPDGDAERLLTREEWQAAWILARKPVPKQVPSLRAALHMIARQGGFLGRKSDGEPGVKSLWLGLQQIASCVAGMRFQQSCG